MKNSQSVITILCLFLVQLSSAQTEPTYATEDDLEEPVFQVVEKTPQPKEGMQEYYKFLARNIKYPEEDKKKGVEGKAFVQFIVEKDGRITDVKPHRKWENYCSEAMMEEALRVIKLSDDWNPGMQRGEPVRVSYTIPIKFSLGR